MLLNLVSCLLLFPAVVFDLSLDSPEMEEDSEEDMEEDERVSDGGGDGGGGSGGGVGTGGSRADDGATSGRNAVAATNTAASLSLCIWSTLISSMVTSGSILAMLAVGECSLLLFQGPFQTISLQPLNYTS